MASAIPSSAFSDDAKKKNCASVPRILSESEKRTAQLDQYRKDIYEFFKPIKRQPADVLQSNFEYGLSELREAAKVPATAVEATNILRDIFIELTAKHQDVRNALSAQIESLYADLYLLAKEEAKSENQKVFEDAYKSLENDGTLLKVLDYSIEDLIVKMKKESAKGEKDSRFAEYQKIYKLNLESELLSTADAQSILDSLAWNEHFGIIDPHEFKGMGYINGKYLPYPAVLFRSLNGSSDPSRHENEMNLRARLYATTILLREKARSHQKNLGAEQWRAKNFVRDFDFWKSMDDRSRVNGRLDQLGVSKKSFEHYIRLSGRQFIQRHDIQSLDNLLNEKVAFEFAQEFYDYAIGIQAFEVAAHLRRKSTLTSVKNTKHEPIDQTHLSDEISVALLDSKPGSLESTLPLRRRQEVLLKLSKLVELEELTDNQIRSILSELSDSRRLESFETRFLIDEVLFKIYLRHSLPAGIKEFILSEFTLKDSHSDWMPNIPEFEMQVFKTATKFTLANARQRADLTKEFLGLALDSTENVYLQNIADLNESLRKYVFEDPVILNNLRGSVDRQIEHEQANKKVKLALFELQANVRQAIFREILYLRNEMKTDSPKQAEQNIDKIISLSMYPNTMLLGVDAFEKMLLEIERKSIKKLLLNKLKNFRGNILRWRDPISWETVGQAIFEETENSKVPSGKDRQIYSEAIKRIDELLHKLDSNP
ncbi:MAG: hypothetical protein J0L93_02405 [Deltaproteobacteria bacterium]|nr:hypothetical protein [Deltaproteobacteria bacterium]